MLEAPIRRSLLLISWIEKGVHKEFVVDLHDSGDLDTLEARTTASHEISLLLAIYQATGRGNCTCLLLSPGGAFAGWDDTAMARCPYSQRKRVPAGMPESIQRCADEGMASMRASRSRSYTCRETCALNTL